MEVRVSGKLIDCVNNKSKDGKKDYYSLNIYNNGNLFRVGINYELYLKYQDLVGENVVLDNVSIWVQGNYSLYIK